MTFFNESEAVWIILARAILCCILRAGYMIVQIGESPAAKIQTIVNLNIIELFVASFSFGVFGRSIIFTSAEEEPIPSDYDDFFDDDGQETIRTASTFYVWTAVISATTIFTAATAGRIHTVGHMILTAAIAGFIHPLAMRLTWTSNSFMKDATFLDYKVTYLDSGSFSHVHLLAGTAALFTAAFLGRSIRQKNSCPSELTSAHISFGYFLVMLGTIGLTLPLTSSLAEIQPPQWTNFFPESYESLVANNAIAALGGYSVSTISQFALDSTNDRRFVQNLQAALAGMVTASSAIYLFTPFTSLVVGVIGGLTFLVVQNVTSASLIEDHCNVVTTHMVCGLIGSLYPKKMTEWSLEMGREAVVNFLWEVVCNLGLHAMFNVTLVAILVTLARLGYVKRSGTEGRRLHRRNGGLVERDEELGGKGRLAKRLQRMRKKH